MQISRRDANMGATHTVLVQALSRDLERLAGEARS